MQSTDIIAILCSDLHLQAKPPVARSGEPNWFQAMARPLWELKRAQEKHNCPIFMAGDIFDRWNSAPEVINWAIRSFPKMVWAVPGQHDLPQHRYEERQRTAYGTLVAAGVIHDMEPGGTTSFNCHDSLESVLEVTGCPWGHEIPDADAQSQTYRVIRLLVGHRYVWKRGTGYPGAPDEAKVGGLKEALKGYDAAVFGDNHKKFVATVGDCNVANTGGMMRRKTDEIDMKPGYVLLMADGSLVEVPYDITDDIIEKKTDTGKPSADLDMDEYIAALKDLGGEDGLDFIMAVKAYFTAHDTLPEVVEAIDRAME